MGGQRGFDPKVIGQFYAAKHKNNKIIIKLSVKNIVVPLWQGAKGKFGG